VRTPARSPRSFLRFLTAAAVATAWPAASHAAERWIDRSMTIPRLVFAGDVGLGIGHVRFDRGPFRDDDTVTGLGMNLEAGFGITDRLDLGLRTGVRFGYDGRYTGADYYARTLWTETYGTGADTVANPELRIRWVAYAGSVAEVGLDGRIYMPFEAGTRFGTMFGVPLAFHVSDFLRIDTGAYIPIVFRPPGYGTFNGLSIPAYFWFQPSQHFWLGPMAALRVLDPGPGDHDAHLLLGLGMGYQVARPVDLKWWVLFPAVDNDFVRQFGAGFGVQFRIGE
jgi:hypothetical protein